MVSTEVPKALAAYKRLYPNWLPPIAYFRSYGREFCLPTRHRFGIFRKVSADDNLLVLQGRPQDKYSLCMIRSNAKQTSTISKAADQVLDLLADLPEKNAAVARRELRAMSTKFPRS